MVETFEMDQIMPCLTKYIDQTNKQILEIWKKNMSLQLQVQTRKVCWANLVGMAKVSKFLLGIDQKTWASHSNVLHVWNTTSIYHKFMVMQILHKVGPQKAVITGVLNNSCKFRDPSYPLFFSAMERCPMPLRF